MKLGRNDPCHCGSGKKYKQCHFTLDTTPLPGELAWRRLQPTIEKINASLLAESARHFGPASSEFAWEDFNLTPDDQTVPFDEKSPFLPLFIPWFLYHWLPDLGETAESGAAHTQTVAEAYLADPQRRIDPLARRVIEICLTTPFSFHEVMGGQPGRTLELRDLFLGTDAEVFERAAAEPAAVGELLYAKIAVIDDTAVIAAGSPIYIDPSYRTKVLELRVRVIAESASKKGPFIAEQLLQWDDVLRDLYFKIVDEAVDALPETP